MNRRTRHRIGGLRAGRGVALSVARLRRDARAAGPGRRGGRGGRAEGLVGNPLNRPGQHPDKGRGGQAADAERGNTRGRHGLSPEPGGQHAGLTVTRTAWQGWRTGPAAELGQRPGLTGQLGTGGICAQRGQKVYDRPQSRRWLR
jgi:hypothetical protein